MSEVTTYLARGRQSKQGSSSHFLIKSQHVQMGAYVETKLTLSPDAADHVRDKAIAQHGDTLIACSAAGCLGRVAYFTKNGKICSTDTHVAIARPNATVIRPEYLFAYLRSAPGQFQLRSRERGDWTKEKIGFRLAELNLSDLQQVPVPLPSFHEQDAITEHLKRVSHLVTAVKELQGETYQELQSIVPAMLNQAFEGEL